MKKFVEIHLFTTLACNLKCSYCCIQDIVGEKAFPKYSHDDLDLWLRRFYGRQVMITFYGGEPTVNLQYIEEVVRRHPDFIFQMQTNGYHVTKLPQTVWSKMDHCLISIDGSEQSTDHFRGAGAYKMAREASKFLRDRDIPTTARMTYAGRLEPADVLEMLDSFSHLHFQFVHDYGHSGSAEHHHRKETLKWMVDAVMELDLNIIPIMGAIRGIFRPDLVPPGPQCRLGPGLYNVTTNGHVYSCPDLALKDEASLGTIWKTVEGTPVPTEPRPICKDCSASDW
jgi:uncharacterized protein